jgi:hypothetical protein
MTILLALLYMSAIIFVGTFLFVMVDVLEPNARLAFVFKCALLAAGGSAVMAQLFRSAVAMGP